VNTRQPYTVLHRTFTAAFETAIEVEESGKKIAWVGGIKSYNLGNISDLYYLKSEKTDKIYDPRLSSLYPEYDDYKITAEETEDPEMMRTCKIVERYGHSIPSLLYKIRNATVEKHEKAHVILSTAHRSKGLEWKQVQLANDFSSMDGDEQSEEEVEDEANLLYVSLTRTTDVLDISDALRELC